MWIHLASDRSEALPPESLKRGKLIGLDEYVACKECVFWLANYERLLLNVLTCARGDLVPAGIGRVLGIAEKRKNMNDKEGV